jgi:hypothetical protein
MVPAAIGSERKRHMPASTTAIPPMAINDWSSVPKRKSNLFLFSCSTLFFVLLEPYPYPQQQQQQQQQQTRDYPR